MKKLTSRDYERLKGVDPRLVALTVLAQQEMNLMVIEGLRTSEKQAEYVKKGTSKTMNSKHLKGLAVDLGPLPLDWNNIQSFKDMGVKVKKIANEQGIPIKWGGDFKSFFDGPHFEIKE